MRALLDLLRENRAAVQDMAARCIEMMDRARSELKVLDPETGDEELIESWAGERAQLRRGKPG